MTLISTPHSSHFRKEDALGKKNGGEGGLLPASSCQTDKKWKAWKGGNTQTHIEQVSGSLACEKHSKPPPNMLDLQVQQALQIL